MKLSEVSTVQAPTLPKRGVLSSMAYAVQAVTRGLKVTFHYFSRPSTVVTEQYPENRDTLKMHERSRARLSMIHDENGFHKCTACTFCEQACPNASIRVFERKQSATGKPEIDYLIWHMERCAYCNACVKVCPFGVLTFSGSFENSVFDKRLLAYNLTKYAGPTSRVLMKVTDEAERKKMIEPRTPYSGPGTINDKKKGSGSSEDKS